MAFGLSLVLRKTTEAFTEKKRERFVIRRAGKLGNIVKVIDVSKLPAEVRDMVTAAKLPYLTARTRCPCGSGKRFKRCHGAGLNLSQ